MFQEKHDKLIGLIHGSTVLSPRERAEWSQLLGLMNDKQVNELEKILEVAAEQDRAAAPAQMPAMQPKSSPTPPVARPPLPMPMPRPSPVTPESLIHVLEAKKPAPFVAKPTRPLEDIQRGQPFTRIKDILAEKELPQGHPGPLEELELSAPKLEVKPLSKTVPLLRPDRPVPPVARPPLSVPIPSKPAFSAIRPPVAVPFAKPIPKPLPVTPESLIRNFEAKKPAPPLARPMLPVPVPKPKAVPEISPNLPGLPAKKFSGQDGLSARPESSPPILPQMPIKQQVSQRVEREGVSAGVSLEKVRGFDQAGKVFQSAQKQPSVRERYYEKPNIDSLQSLARLTYSNFSPAKTAEIFDPVCRLIGKYGYHDTRSFLEQSPLYQTYVDTGVKVLGGQADFVQEWEGLMPQEDFEKFTDLLIQMHTV